MTAVDLDVYPVGVVGPDNRRHVGNDGRMLVYGGDTYVWTPGRTPHLAFYVPGAVPTGIGRPGVWTLTMDTGVYEVRRMPLTCDCQNLPLRYLPAAELVALAARLYPPPAPLEPADMRPTMAPPGGDGPVLGRH